MVRMVYERPFPDKVEPSVLILPAEGYRWNKVRLTHSFFHIILRLEGGSTLSCAPTTRTGKCFGSLLYIQGQAAEKQILPVIDTLSIHRLAHPTPPKKRYEASMRPSHVDLRNLGAEDDDL